MSARLQLSTLLLVICFLWTIQMDLVSAEEACLLRYDTNDSTIQLDLSDLNQTFFRGEPGIPGKRGPEGPPGPIGGSENDTMLRIRYDDKIAALEARLDALSNPSWFLATNGFRYKVIETSKTFEAAKVLCQEVGANLATIGMRQSRIRRELKQYVMTPIGRNAWVGLVDVSHWEWLDGVVSNAENTDWDTPGKEPNNNGGNEKCAHMRSTSGRDWRLNDIPCNIPLYSLCEKAI